MSLMAMESFESYESNEIVGHNRQQIVKFTQDVMQRARSEKIDYRNDNLVENSQLKHSKLCQIRKYVSENKEIRPLLKQDSKESKREWLKKQLSINHHYLKDLRVPLNSISHRNAMLNIKGYKLRASSCPDIFKNSIITVNEHEEVIRPLKIIFSTRIDKFI